MQERQEEGRGETEEKQENGDETEYLGSESVLSDEVMNGEEARGSERRGGGGWGAV